MSAGLIVEEKSKTTWEAFTQKNILDKLSMTSTYFGLPQQSEKLDIANPYLEETKLPYKEVTNIAPAGSMYSNIVDMTVWIQSFMQNKWPNQEDFFKPRIPLINGPEGNLNYAYGLCWMTNRMIPNITWNFHGGNIDGFSTLVLFSHELNLGIVIMINQDGSSLPDQIVTDLLLAAIKEKTISADNTHNKNFDKALYNIKFFNTDQRLSLINKTNKELESIETFHHPGYGDLTISLKDGDLYAKYYSGIWKLKTYDNHDFNFLGEGKISIPFKLDSDFVEVPFEPQVSNIHFRHMSGNN